MFSYLIAGVDNGFSGAIVKLRVGHTPDLPGGIQVLEKHAMPVFAPTKKGEKSRINETRIKEILEGCEHVFIETAQAMNKGRGEICPACGRSSGGQGISSTARYMQANGMVHGICTGMGIPKTEIAVITWKRMWLAGMPPDKSSSIIAAQRLIPGLSLPYNKDHCYADAIFVALTGARKQGWI